MKNTILARNIHYLRKARQLSQRELAEQLGLKRNQIASYEAGQVEPRVNTFILLSEYFGVDAEQLLTEELSEQAEGKRQHHPHPED